MVRKDLFLKIRAGLNENYLLKGKIEMSYTIDKVNAISQILDSEGSFMNNQRNYIIAESFILELLNEYMQEQGKVFLREYNRFDGYAPEGIDEYEGKTVFEIKLYRNKSAFRNIIRELVLRFLAVDREIENIIFVSILNFEDNEKERLLNSIISTEVLNDGIKVDIWDIKKLDNLLHKDNAKIKKVLENTNNNYLKIKIEDSVKQDDDWKERRNQQISDLRDRYKEDNIALFLGAGASADAKIPQWDSLVSGLFINLLSSELKNQNINISDNDKSIISNEFKNICGDSPLMQARYLRNGLKGNFQQILKDILYEGTANSSPLISEIIQLCIPGRNRVGIKGIINYNFDDLIEYNLKKHRIDHKSIFKDGITPNNDELGIYHVHGFLPRNNYEYEVSGESLLVFSEEGYHELMIEPYNWANLIQLSYLRENTCLLIGLSVTDPNLRRLLDIAMRKNSEAEYRHYVILRREEILEEKVEKAENPESIRCFQNVNYKLKEENLKELGLNVIWVENYEEIPDILKRIKE